MNQHHPFRLEVQEVTPVSISLLWSLRPPPITAIPKDIAARSAAPTSLKSSPAPRSPPQVNTTPVHKLAEGVVATRSLNRKVTKIRLRGTSQGRFQQIHQSQQQQRNSSTTESDDWPSDDGATAVNDDALSDRDSASDTSELPRDGESTSAMTKIFESGVSVAVNGLPWSHVVMGDRGPDEAVIVVFGLLPGREYEMEMSVGSKDGSKSVAVKGTVCTEGNQGEQ